MSQSRSQQKLVLNSTTRKIHQEGLGEHFLLFQQKVTQLVTEEFARCDNKFNTVMRQSYVKNRKQKLQDLKEVLEQREDSQNPTLVFVYKILNLANDIDGQKTKDALIGAKVSVFASRLRNEAASFLIYQLRFLNDLKSRVQTNQQTVMNKLWGVSQKTKTARQQQQNIDQELEVVFNLLTDLQQQNKLLVDQIELKKMLLSSVRQEREKMKNALKFESQQVAKMVDKFKEQREIARQLSQEVEELKQAKDSDTAGAMGLICACQRSLEETAKWVNDLKKLSQDSVRRFREQTYDVTFYLTQRRGNHEKIMATLRRANAPQSEINAIQHDHEEEMTAFIKRLEIDEAEQHLQMEQMHQILDGLNDSIKKTHNKLQDVVDAMLQQDDGFKQRVAKIQVGLYQLTENIDKALSEDYEAMKQNLSQLMTRLYDKSLEKQDIEITETVEGMVATIQQKTTQTKTLVAQIRQVGVQCAKNMDLVNDELPSIIEDVNHIAHQDVIEKAELKRWVEKELIRLKKEDKKSSKIKKIEAALDNVMKLKPDDLTQSSCILALVQALAIHRNLLTLWKPPASFINVENKLKSHFAAQQLVAPNWAQLRLR